MPKLHSRRSLSSFDCASAPCGWACCLLVGLAGAVLLEVVGGCEECVHDSGVLQVVESLSHKPADIGELVDVRAFQTAKVGEQALAARGYLAVGKH